LVEAAGKQRARDQQQEGESELARDQHLENEAHAASARDGGGLIIDRLDQGGAGAKPSRGEAE